MLPPNKVIKEYRVTEKATNLAANHNQHIFEVFTNVNRIDVARAVERLFDVKVARVNILIQKGKHVRSRTSRGAMGKRSDTKKAIVTLKEGHAIELA